MSNICSSICIGFLLLFSCNCTASHWDRADLHKLVLTNTLVVMLPEKNTLVVVLTKSTQLCAKFSLGRTYTRT